MAKKLLSDATVRKLQGILFSSFDCTCIISRPEQSALETDYGQTVEPTKPYPLHLTDLPCSIQAQSFVTAGERQNLVSSFIEGRYLLSVPFGTDVKVTDRVEEVKDRFNQPFDPTVKFYEIKDRASQMTHIVLTLEAVR